MLYSRLFRARVGVATPVRLLVRKESTSSAPRRMPSIRQYFSTNPSAPVVILVAWMLSVLGGLVAEKNKRDAMIEKLENHKTVLTALISRVAEGEKVDVERELTLVNEQSKSFEQVLQDLEKEDEQWSSGIAKLDEEPAPSPSKKRRDVDQKFV